MPRGTTQPPRAEDAVRRRGWGAYELADTRIAPGESADIRLKVGEMYNAEPVSIPVTVVRGDTAGPTVFLTAAVHGDELNGVAIIRDLLAEEPLRLLAGTLVAVPVVNVPGFLGQSRLPPDRRDLNRVFPGSAKGSLSARIAAAVFRHVVRGSDFGIDLHTGGAERRNYPHVRADLELPAVAELARAFAAPLIVHGAGPERSLRRAAVAAGVPTISYEAGGTRLFERPLIDLGLAGVRNVLASLGMIAPLAGPPPPTFEVRSTRWVRARAGGILDLKVELGQPLRRRQILSINTNPFGRERSQLRAPHDGLALGLTRSPLVHPGDAVCHLAELDNVALDAWRSFWESGRGRIAP